MHYFYTYAILNLLVIINKNKKYMRNYLKTLSDEDHTGLLDALSDHNGKYFKGDDVTPRLEDCELRNGKVFAPTSVSEDRIFREEEGYIFDDTEVEFDDFIELTF